MGLPKSCFYVLQTRHMYVSMLKMKRTRIPGYVHQFCCM